MNHWDQQQSKAPHSAHGWATQSRNPTSPVVNLTTCCFKKQPHPLQRTATHLVVGNTGCATALSTNTGFTWSVVSNVHSQSSFQHYFILKYEIQTARVLLLWTVNCWDIWNRSDFQRNPDYIPQKLPYSMKCSSAVPRRQKLGATPYLHMQWALIPPLLELLFPFRAGGIAAHLFFCKSKQSLGQF